MSIKKFYLIPFCALLVISSRVGLTFPIRAAFLLVAFAAAFDVISILRKLRTAGDDAGKTDID